MIKMGAKKWNAKRVSPATGLELQGTTGQMIEQGFDVIRFIVTNIRKHVFLLISYQKPGHPHEQLVDDDALVNN